MPVINRVADLQPDIQAWRRDIHAHPELGRQEFATTQFVATHLAASPAVVAEIKQVICVKG